jgi:putative ABC transport system permease protein
VSPLLLRSLLRHLPRHPWPAGLAVFGVALGVAVAVAIDLANASATRAFELSTTALAGRATHAIEPVTGGLPERLFTRVARDPDLGPAAPVVEGYGLAESPGAPREGRGTTLRVLGIDPFSEGPFRPELAALGGAGAEGGGVSLSALVTRPGTGLLAPGTAEELGVAPGDRFELRVAGVARPVELIGLLDPATRREREILAGLLLTDVTTAQELLGKVGRLDRIEMMLPEPAQAARVRKLLPPAARLRRVGARARSLSEMTRAFRLNLTALSLLALVCGVFLIYNTATFSVVQRRSLVGTLRALGATRRELFAALLLEAAILGAVGTALGLALGVGLGRLLVDLVTRTINDLYFVLSVRGLDLDPWILARGAALGIGATVAAALAPTIEAASTRPRAVLARSSLEARARRSVPRAAAAGALLLAAGGALLAAPWPAGRLAGPFAGLFAVTLACALLAPGATVVLMTLLRRPAGAVFGVLGTMAARGVVATLSRTGVAAAALVIAVSVTVGIGVMVGSFRATVVRWLDHTLRADVYLSPAGPGRGAGEARMAPETLRRIAATPGAAGLEPLRRVEVAWRPAAGTGGDERGGVGGRVRLVALDLAGRGGEGFRLKAGDRDEAFVAAARDEAVLLSEPFAYRLGLGTGDAIRLVTPEGPRSFLVAGVYYDYGADQGAVLIDLGAYRRRFHDPALSAVSVRAAPGVDPEALASRLRRATAGSQLLDVRSERVLRETSLAIFDRTFEITRVLRWLAGLVAFIGILAALMALQLERARELGVLRANGLTPGQVWRLVTSETALLGLAAGLLAIPVGLLLAAVMVFVINRRSFGWTLEMSVAPQILAQALALALAAALLAGLYPAWRMARTSPAEALREE